MKIFLSILLLVCQTLAEPPVGDGYPAAQLSHDHSNNESHDEHHDHQPLAHQSSLSQEYGVPSTASSRNALSTEYGVPNARTPYNTRKQPQKQRRPAARVSFNQRFRSAASRSSAQDHTAFPARTHSQEFATSNARSGISQEYGVPSTRSLSQEYGVPSVVSARTLSTEYGMPDARSTPSEEYGVPVVARRKQRPHSSMSTFRNVQPAEASSPNIYKPAAKFSHTDSQRQGYSEPSTRSNDIAQDYAAPAAQNQAYSLSQAYTAPVSRSNNVDQTYNEPKPLPVVGSASRKPSHSYGAPKNAPLSTYDAPASRSLSSSYGVPSSRNSGSNTQDSNSESYNAPNEADISATYGVPHARSPSQEYGVPTSRANQKPDAVPSSYSPARAALSSTYLPSARDAMPSQQYGVPEDSNKGYDYTQARALNELLNQEPANYDFAYQIEDQESGSDFGHTETREENRAEGSYFVVLPDGTKQTVDYEADERGFKPRISVEPATAARSGTGYDENSAELPAARSVDGPY